MVTRGKQKKIEVHKTIVDTSNRFRVVGDVVCDDFMQFGRLLVAERVPSRLARPSHVSWTIIEAARRALSHEPGARNSKWYFFGRKIQYM